MGLEGYSLVLHPVWALFLLHRDIGVEDPQGLVIVIIIIFIFIVIIVVIIIGPLLLSLPHHDRVYPLHSINVFGVFCQMQRKITTMENMATELVSRGQVLKGTER